MLENVTYTKKIQWTVVDGTPFAYFRSSLKGGKLPDNVEVFINFNLSFNEVECDKRIRDYVVSAWRIEFQKMLRDQCGVDVVKRLEKDGFGCNVAAKVAPDMVLTPQDRIAQLKRFLNAQDPEVKAALIADLQKDS